MKYDILIGLDEVPVIVHDADDERMLELALVENLQREDLNAIDRARAYRRFCTAFDLRPEEVARRLAEDRTTVVNYVRLLDLSDAIQERVSSGDLSMGHARSLLGVSDLNRREQLADAVTANQLSVRALEDTVRREREKGDAPPPTDASSPRSPDAVHIENLQRRFETATRTRVLIRPGKKKGSGRITIEYFTLDDFDRISSLLGVQAE